MPEQYECLRDAGPQPVTEKPATWTEFTLRGAQFSARIVQVDPLGNVLAQPVLEIFDVVGVAQLDAALLREFADKLGAGSRSGN
jgi:hypothetical protein